MESSICTSWLEIDLGAIQNNIRLLQQMTKKQVMAVVKANAYGHGMPEVVKAAFAAGVNWFGVARIEEALQVREAAPRARILVMGYTPPEMVAEAVKQDVTLTVYDYETASMYSQKVGEASGKARIHIKYDTGMGRLGYHLADTLEFTRRVLDLPGLELEGVFTHFARADEPALETTPEQIARFERILTTLRQNGIQPSVNSCL